MDPLIKVSNFPSTADTAAASSGRSKAPVHETGGYVQIYLVSSGNLGPPADLPLSRHRCCQQRAFEGPGARGRGIRPDLPCFIRQSPTARRFAAQPAPLLPAAGVRRLRSTRPGPFFCHPRRPPSPLKGEGRESVILWDRNPRRSQISRPKKDLGDAWTGIFRVFFV